MKKKSLLSLVLAVIFVCMAFAGCGTPAGSSSAGGQGSSAEASGSPEAPVEYAEEIIWGTSAGQDTLDPQNNSNNAAVVKNVYSGLLRANENMEPVADIAYEWSVAADNCTWTFKLRDDVTFHNGKKLTVDDIIATFDRMLDTANPQRMTQVMSYIDSYYAPDANTFVIVTKRPIGAFEADIAAQRCAILDKDYIEKYGNDLGKSAEACNGTGAYKVASYKPQEEIVFEAHESYHRGAPLTKKITMVVITEAASRTIAIETGQVDMVTNIVPEDVASLSAKPGLKGISVESNGCHLFQFNCAALPDARVRQAIAYAVDKELLVKALFSELGEVPMRNVIAPSILGWSDLGVFPYDVAKAKALLTEAGFPNGFDMKIMTTNIYNRGIEMAEIIKENLKEVGINATIVEVDRATFTESRASLTVEQFNEKYGWEMFIMGSGGNADPDQILNRIWHTDPSGTNLNNYGWYSNARADELLEKGASSVDPAERQKIYEELSQILYIDDPVGVFMNLRNNIYILRDTIEGFKPNGMNFSDWSKMGMKKA